jgi:hypothetical protein
MHSHAERGTEGREAVCIPTQKVGTRGASTLLQFHPRMHSHAERGNEDAERGNEDAERGNEEK